MFVEASYRGKTDDKKPPAVDRCLCQRNFHTGMYYLFLAVDFESRHAPLTKWAIWTYKPFVVSLVIEAYEYPTKKHVFRQLSTVMAMLSMYGPKGEDIIGAVAKLRCQQPRL
jgi:hypothetical protein